MILTHMFYVRMYLHGHGTIGVVVPSVWEYLERQITHGRGTGDLVTKSQRPPF